MRLYPLKINITANEILSCWHNARLPDVGPQDWTSPSALCGPPHSARLRTGSGGGSRWPAGVNITVPALCGFTASAGGLVAARARGPVARARGPVPRARGPVAARGRPEGLDITFRTQWAAVEWQLVAAPAGLDITFWSRWAADTGSWTSVFALCGSPPGARLRPGAWWRQPRGRRAGPPRRTGVEGTPGLSTANLAETSDVRCAARPAGRGVQPSKIFGSADC